MPRLLPRTAVPRPFLRLAAGALLACGLLAAPAARAEGNLASGENQFRRCSACHQIGPGAQNGVGPQLTGIIGRAIASAPGFRYTEGLRDRAGMVWTEELVATYIADPGGFIGQRSPMPAQRLRPGQVADLIAYLASQGD